MKLFKIGLRTWEKETHPVPGPEITTKTLVVLKMMTTIDKGVDGTNDKLTTIQKLLQLNHKLNIMKKK